MKTIKSILCIVLSLLMVLSVVACGNTETPSDTDSSVDAGNSSVVDDTSSEETEEPEESEEPSEEEPEEEEPEEEPEEPEEEEPKEEEPEEEEPEEKPETSSKVETSSKAETSSKEEEPEEEEPEEGDTNGPTSLSWSDVKKTLPSNASGKTIEIMEWNSQTPMNKKVCQAFEQQTGMKVVYTEEGYSSYMAKIASRVATGNPPTVARLRDNVPEYMSAMQPIQNTGYNFNDTYWDKDILDAYTFDGRTYGVALKNTPYYQPVVTYYNQTIIDKYGLEDPYELWKDGEWTWSKMLELCQDVIDESAGKIWGLSPLFGEYMYSTGNTYVKFENGQFINNVESPGVIKGMQYLNKAHKKGLITDATCLRDDFNLGKGLFLFDAEIGARMGHYYVKELKRTGVLRCVPVPAVDGQKDYYVCISELEAYGIVNKCANVELAPYFLRYYLDAEQYDMDNFYSHESFLEVVDWTRQYEGIPTYFSLWQAGMPGSTWNCEESQINQLVTGTHKPYIKSNVDAANAQLKKLVK